MFDYFWSDYFFIVTLYQLGNITYQILIFFEINKKKTCVGLLLANMENSIIQWPKDTPGVCSDVAGTGRLLRSFAAAGEVMLVRNGMLPPLTDSESHNDHESELCLHQISCNFDQITKEIKICLSAMSEILETAYTHY